MTYFVTYEDEVPMIIREVQLAGNVAPLKVYRVPDPQKFSGPAYQKWAGQVNSFFHRSARDGIRYNRTNLRLFTRTEDKTYEVERSLADLNRPQPDIIDCAALDDFFSMIGFDYRLKTWTAIDEWSMRIKHKDGGVDFVNPKSRK